MSMRVPVLSRKLSLFFLLGVAISTGCARSQPQPNGLTLADGLARIQANDYAGAAKILENVTRREPQNGRAWRNLALAYQKLKDLEGAIRADQRALNVEPAVLVSYFPFGHDPCCAGDKDQAFAWLGKAKATHKIDMTQIEATPELASLKGDARFAALLPSPEDFKNPFVEDVKIIREWNGEAANDQFGWIARNLGDVDGDGVPDVVTSAPTHGTGGVKAGRIYVYSTKTGKKLWTADGKAGDELGTGVEAAGDTNGDGIPDVIASAPGGGYAKVYSGRNGRVLLTVKAEGPNDDFRAACCRGRRCKSRWVCRFHRRCSQQQCWRRQSRSRLCVFR